ncbi:MAG: ROK family protein [Candidatus Obscuribacterales bacterium]|nr:ROK family protein [Candidatus Obscuribacterales bacterium]
MVYSATDVIPGWKGIRITDAFTEALGLPSAVDNVVRDAELNPNGAGSQAITKTGECLGFGLVTLANALDPDLIVIGGGLSELGDALLEPARKILKEHALPGPAKSPVVVAQLGLDAAIVGAASLVMLPSNKLF